MPTILVIDDNPAVATALEVLFSLHDIATVHAGSPEAGLALLDEGDVDLVIQDMNFSADTTSGDEGRALFAAIRERHPDLPVVLLTAWTHLESAVELIKAGAADYVAKPWQDAKLLATVNNLLNWPKRGASLTCAATASAAAATTWPGATTCAARCSPTRPASGWWRWPARSPVPSCRCWSPGPTAAARRRSPRSSRPIRRTAAARSSPSTAARCRPS